MMSRLRALLDPRLAVLLVPLIAVGVFLVVSGPGSQATATHATTTTVFQTEPASSHSDFKIPPKIPANAPLVHAPDYGDTNPIDRALRDRVATVRAARAAMGDPIDAGDSSNGGASPTSVDGLTVQSPTTTVDAGIAATTTIASGSATTTTVATPTTLLDGGPQPVVSESGSPLVLLVVAVGCAAAVVVGVGWWRRVRVRRAA
jgi:hypothetical protein